MDSNQPDEQPSMMQNVANILQQALERFLHHDGWAIASHLALSVLMSLFPFLIFITALSSLSGAANLSDEVAKLLFEVWPSEVAEPIAREVRQVLTIARSDALTLGAVLSLYFASSGVEAVRVGLNRAYDAVETRAWWLTRLESIAFVILGAIALIAFAFLVVLGPLGWRLLSRWIPALSTFSGIAAFLRIAIASLLVVTTLILAHRFLPTRQARGHDIWPGVAFTILLWLACGYAFGLYLDSFAGSYVSTYAGLATAMILLVFMYILAAIFLLGVEINGVLALSNQAVTASPQSQPPNASSTSS
jgi:membrane protein